MYAGIEITNAKKKDKKFEPPFTHSVLKDDNSDCNLNQYSEAASNLD